MWVDIDDWKGKPGSLIWGSDGTRIFQAFVMTLGPGKALDDGYFTTPDREIPLPVCYVWTGPGQPPSPPPSLSPPSDSELKLWLKERKATGKALTNALRCLLLLQRPSERIYNH